MYQAPTQLSQSIIMLPYFTYVISHHRVLIEAVNSFAMQHIVRNGFRLKFCFLGLSEMIKSLRIMIIILICFSEDK